MYIYKYTPLKGKKCLSCKFCIWDEERREYVCEIKGCYEYSKYELYELYGLRKTDSQEGNNEKKD